MIPTAGANKQSTHTHTHAAAGIEVIHTLSGFRRLSRVHPPQRSYTLHINPKQESTGTPRRRGTYSFPFRVSF